MKRRKKPATASRGFTIAFFFGAAVVIAVLFALAIKIGIVFSQSTFDGHTFILRVKSTQQAQSLISFSPIANTISVLQVSSVPKNIRVDKELLVPATASVTTSFSTSNIKSFTRYMVFHFKDISPTMTIIDAVRLMLFTQLVEQNAITIKTYPYPLDATQQLVSSMFVDPTLYKDGMTIAVVNASGISGLGSKVAKELTNIGANVVSVKTSDAQSTTSTIAYMDGESYTVKKLIRILGFIGKKDQVSQFSDITIILGQDALKRGL